MPIFLKIILCFLMLIVAIVIFALVCPVTYKLYFKKQETELLFSVKANFLLGLVHFMFRYPGEEQVTIRVFGFPLRNKKDKTNTQVKASEQKNNNDVIASTDTETTTENTQDSFETPKTNEEVETSETQAKEDSQSDKDKQNKASMLTRCKKIKKEFDFYRRLLEAEFTNTFIKDALNRVLQIVSSILPKRLRGHIRFGGNSPDITGLAMAGYGMLCCNRRWFKNFTFEVDFEEPVFEGEAWTKGSILPIILLWNAIRILFDKRFRKIRNVLKTHKNRKLKKEKKDG